MDLLTVTDISKQLPGGFTLAPISFEVPALRKIALAGETGSGKTTLLRIIGGLIQPDSGEVRLEGKKVKGPMEKLIPGHERIAYLSQHYELPNHYTVENILEYASKMPEHTAEQLYEICQITHLLKRKTDQLSGGEKQRIALARMLTTLPDLLLLDEPFSNADMLHKQRLKEVIRDIGEQLSITCILVSHDPLDSLSWADELLVLRDGKLIQRDNPLDIYHQPKNEYVAGLFGTYNLLPSELFPRLSAGAQIMIRPEQFIPTDQSEAIVSGIVKEVLFYGSFTELEVRIANRSLWVRVLEPRYSKGDVIHLTMALGSLHAL
ncbi:ABC transporter ATP-binding protein [Terrimonas ferruginea]|uniref:ABC transporter ATP-binding protein n=1 Tax=Terrimonas ferruginea TaxID=249 RepID=UPI0003F6E3CF|nr:ABC transporter ATP-binding protein [Terrimonas ferruginea]